MFQVEHVHPKVWYGEWEVIPKRSQFIKLSYNLCHLYFRHWYQYNLKGYYMVMTGHELGQLTLLSIFSLNCLWKDIWIIITFIDSYFFAGFIIQFCQDIFILLFYQRISFISTFLLSIFISIFYIFLKQELKIWEIRLKHKFREVFSRWSSTH